MDLDDLAAMLSGETCLEGLSPWRSQIRGLARALTFLENNPTIAPKLLSHQKLVALAAQQKTKTHVIGLTGLPGAGKSTLTSGLVKVLRARGEKVAVIAVDPSSVLSGGALLGDRVRMHEHFRDDDVFIRSMGSRGALGGMARATRGAVRLAKLLSFDTILVETVGIGQSESAVAGLADTTVLILMPHSGDEIQLMKAGILQLAQVYVVNKCDLGDPSRMIAELEENLMPLGEAGTNCWRPPVLKASALNHMGFEDIIAATDAHRAHQNSTGTEFWAFQKKRIQAELLQDLIFMAENHFRQQLETLPESTWQALKEGTTTTTLVGAELWQDWL